MPAPPPAVPPITIAVFAQDRSAWSDSRAARSSARCAVDARDDDDTVRVAGRVTTLSRYTTGCASGCCRYAPCDAYAALRVMQVTSVTSRPPTKARRNTASSYGWHCIGAELNEPLPRPPVFATVMAYAPFGSGA